MWPTAPACVSDALKTEVPISLELDRWTSTNLALTAVKGAASCGDAVVLLLDGCVGTLRQSNLAIWREGKGSSTADLQPLLLEGFPRNPEGCSRIWPGIADAFLARCGDIIWRVELGELAAGSKGVAVNMPEHSAFVSVNATQVWVLPPRITGLDCSVSADGGWVFAALAKPNQGPSMGPLIMRPGQSLEQLPAATLCVYCSVKGQRALADVPRLSEQLVISKGSRKVCVWRAFLNEVPEEAERGEFFAVELDGGACDYERRSGKHQVVSLTKGAGRVGEASISHDASIILIQANFSEFKPITTHMSLILLIWPAGRAGPLPERRELIVGDHIMSFGFLPTDGNDDGHAFWVTRLEGVDARSEIWRCPSASSGPLKGEASVAAFLTAPVLSRDVEMTVPSTTKSGQRTLVVYGTERADALPSVVVLDLDTIMRSESWRLESGFGGGDGGAAKAPEVEIRSLTLPQPQGTDIFSVEKVTYQHQKQEVTALLFERRIPPCREDAPLLVMAHGGPAIGVLNSLRAAVDPIRYPYRHFLAAGYRVFVPLFRGTLGFGDAWAQGNIGTQGSPEGDLGDILAGLDWLAECHPRLKGTIVPERTGIYGGSYGGYMTIRAMVERPERFGAGVALYGFVHNRWMTYEGGDFTWEDEYLLPPAGASSPEVLGFGLDVEMVVEERGTIGEAGGGGSAPGSAFQPPARPNAAADPSTPTASPHGGSSSGRRPRAGSRECQSPAASDVWPLPQEMEASDTFNGLHRIVAPLLLLHGEKDDICQLSHSQVVFHMLEKRGVPTGLIVYPGEGHGFDRPEHQRDRDRRMLAWWREHLPVDVQTDVPHVWADEDGKLV